MRGGREGDRGGREREGGGKEGGRKTEEARQRERGVVGEGKMQYLTICESDSRHLGQWSGEE